MEQPCVVPGVDFGQRKAVCRDGDQGWVPVETENLVRAEVEFEMAFVGPLEKRFDVVVEGVLGFVDGVLGFVPNFGEAGEEVDGGCDVTWWWVYLMVSYLEFIKRQLGVVEDSRLRLSRVD